MALIPGTTFDDSLTGGSGADTLTGDLGNDTLDGGAGTDSLSGGDGNDVLVQVGPASGAEVFDGGLGFDTLRLLSNGVTVASPNGPLSSIGLLSASFSGMEAIEFTSTSGTAMSAQMFIFQAYGGFGGTLALTGGAGVDTLFLGASLGGQYQMPNFTFSNWTNTPGGPNDIVVLSAMNAQDYTFYGRDGLGVIQALVGNGGSDFIEGSDGADVIIGNGGNDTLDGDSGNDTLTGGAGADVFVLSGTGQKIITDFNVAEDKFSPGGFDNFTSLQPYLSEVGGNAVFAITYGGTLHTHTFQGVPLASLTASNFVYETVPVDHNDTGSGLADVVRGGAGNDVEDGGAGDDTVYGFAGNDQLLGGDGNDSVNAGSGADTLTGDLGNDTLDGGAGTDSLSGGDGNDVLVQVGPASGAEVFDGGLGFDTLRLVSNGVTAPSPNGPLSNIGLFSASFSGMEAIEFTSTAGTAMTVQMNPGQVYGGFSAPPTLIGGAGVDALSLVAQGGGTTGIPAFTFINWTSGDVVVLIGQGAFNYTLSAADGHAGVEALIGGGGDDLLLGADGAEALNGNGGNDTLDGDSGNDTLTGGAGADVFVLSGTGQKIITDFNVAEDKFSPGGFDNFTSLQPYLSEVGGNAVFSITYGGVVHTHTFQGVPLANLTASNFVYETVPNDHSDTGSGLADVVRGGAGNDVEDGGAGDDTVYGFAGNDWLLGGGGNDSILGGSGNDTLDGGAGADTLVGGTGADSISGGAGADLAIVSPGAGQTTIVSLGTEADTLRLAAGMAAGSSVIVTDFQTGAGGDALSLDAFLAANAGWTPGTDPFAAGLLRLSQNGADAILELDADGAGPGGFATVTTFAGTSALNFTAANLGGYAPQAVTGGAGSDILAYTPPAAPAPGATAPVLDGGAGVDTLTITAPPPPAGAPTGTATIKPSPDGLSLLFDLNGDGVTDLTVKNVEDIVLNGDQVVISGNLVNTGLAPNTIVYNGTAANNLLDAGGLISVESIKAYGGDGNDTLITANDDDLLVGGAGNDSLSARGGPDSLDGGAGDDRLLGGDGADTLDGGTGTDTLDGGADDDLLSGSDGADSLIGGNGLDRLYGGQDADVLDGGNGQDTLDGGTGDDVLRGGGGADFLTGGAGADRFEIDKSGGTDRIFDFTAGDKLVFVGGSGTVAFKAMDLDGDGKVDDLLVSVSKGGFSVELIDVTTLSASDWIFA